MRANSVLLSTAVGILGTLFAAGASAQSTNVTIYGSIDGGVDYLSNVKGNSFFAVNSGKRTPDRIGFRGTEDLGDGLSANFQLENGFNSDTGAQSNPAKLFNRYSWVGLAHKDIGSVRLGHMPDFNYDYVGGITNSVPGISSSYSPGNLDGLANTFGLDNAVRLESVDLKGFQFGVIGALGEVAGDPGNSRSYGAGARYENGPLKVAAGYTMSNNRTADLRTTFGVTSALGQALPTGTMFNTNHYSITALGGQYKIGNFVPHATVTRVMLENSVGSVYERNYELGVNIDLSGGPRIDILGISAAHSTFTQLAYNQLNLFYTHYASLTTQLYVGGSVQRASGAGAVAGFFGYTASSTQSQVLMRAGVQHSF